jgi:hypothetical protein
MSRTVAGRATLACASGLRMLRLFGSYPPVELLSIDCRIL